MRTLVAYWPLTLICLGLPAIAAMLYGCERRPTVELIDAGDDTGDRCAALLEKGIGLIRPEQLGVVPAVATLESNPKEAADTLTQWLRRPDCREAIPTESLSEAAKQLVARLLGPQGVEQLLSERMTPFEAAHLRDALLDFSTADNIARDKRQSAGSDIERILALFDYVSRTVSPQAEGTAELAFSPYEAHLFGRGSAEDRAWLFANLVRQLRTDAVILRPADATENDPWWVAVLLDSGIYLFDPELSAPVPSSTTTDANSPHVLPSPATWSEVVESPGLLIDYRREAGLEAEAIAAERLAAPQVELIGSDTYWSLAMERLELSLTDNRGVLLFDPLHSTQGPGLFDRVVAAGGDFWNADAIGIWSYPQQAREKRGNLSPAQQQRLEQRVRPFLGPVQVNTRGPAPVAEPPSRDLWKTRIEHMSGRPGATIGSYQQIRLAGSADSLLSPNDQSLNSQAADEAYYWTAHAQYGVGEYAAAAATAQDYIEDLGDRSDEAAALRVLCLAADGQFEAAQQAVAELPETTPGLRRLQWLAKRWQPAAEK